MAVDAGRLMVKSCGHSDALRSAPTTAVLSMLSCDCERKMSVDEVIEGLDLKKVVHREISCYGVSAKEETNLEAVLQWLVARSGK